MPDVTESKTMGYSSLDAFFEDEATLERTKACAEEIAASDEYRKAYWQYAGNFRELLGTANARQQILLKRMAGGIDIMTVLLLDRSYRHGCADTLDLLAESSPES